MSEADSGTSTDSLSTEDDPAAADLEFQYEDLWYIKLINETDKNPLERWGGYEQDFEEIDTVYSHDEVLESDHEYWGVVGIQDEDRYLLIFDLDVHKAPDDFDLDSIEVPEETPIVTSQNGGKHVYFIVKSEEKGFESDFSMEYDLGWDIDIRGSYVKHHVVAPNSIPGVGGLYELTYDDSMLTVSDATGAADRIRYLDDPESNEPHGEPLLTYSPSGGFGGDVEIDRDVEPPENMPTCYHRGLQIRQQNPEDPDVNTHKINTLTGLCGLAAGYSIDTMIEHFCKEYAPGCNADERKTRYHLEHMEAKMERGDLAPPKVRTLRNYGILESDEVCGCNIESHDDSVLEMDRTTDIADVFHAIEIVEPEDVRENEETAVNHCNALQVVAYEEGITDTISDYPEGKAFFDAIDALRDRGAHIPEFVSSNAADEDASSIEFGGPDAASDEVVLALAGKLQFAATRKDYTCRCPGCEAPLNNEHNEPCDMRAVADEALIDAYRDLLQALDRQAQSRKTLRRELANWGPVHERVLDHLCNEGTVAPRGDNA